MGLWPGVYFLNDRSIRYLFDALIYRFIRPTRGMLAYAIRSVFQFFLVVVNIAGSRAFGAANIE